MSESPDRFICLSANRLNGSQLTGPTEREAKQGLGTPKGSRKNKNHFCMFSKVHYTMILCSKRCIYLMHFVGVERQIMKLLLPHLFISNWGHQNWTTLVIWNTELIVQLCMSIISWLNLTDVLLSIRAHKKEFFVRLGSGDCQVTWRYCHLDQPVKLFWLTAWFVVKWWPNVSTAHGLDIYSWKTAFSFHVAVRYYCTT